MFARIAKYFKDKKDARRQKAEAERKAAADLEHEQWLARCARDDERRKWELEREKEERELYAKVEAEVRIKNRELALTMLPEERWMFYAGIHLGPHMKKDSRSCFKDFPNLLAMGDEAAYQLICESTRNH